MLSTRWLIYSDLEYIRPLLPNVGMDEDEFISLLRQREVIGLVAVDSANLQTHHAFAAYRLHRSHFEIVCMDGTIPGLDAIIQSLKNKLSQHRRQRVTIAVNEYNVLRQIHMAKRGFYAVPAGEYIQFDYALQADDCHTL